MAAPTIHSTTAPVAGLSSTSNANTVIGDLVIVYTFERTGAGIPTHTIVSGYTTILTHPHNDGSTDGRLSAAFKVATEDGAVAYSGWTSNVGTETWTGLLVVDKDTYSRAIRATSATQTGTAAPNPPDCPGLQFGRDHLAVAISAWRLSSAATVTPAHATYTLQTHIAGSATAELALATLPVTTDVLAINPGAYTDDVTPTGTCSITLVIPEAPTVVSDGGWSRKETESAQLFGGFLSETHLIPLDQIAVDDLVVVTVSGDPDDDAITSVTDSLGNSYTELLADLVWLGDAAVSGLFYTVATAAGVRPVLTATYPGTPASFENLQVARYTGVDTASPVADSSSAEGDSTTWNSAAATAGQGDLLFGFGQAAGSITITGTGGTWVALGSFDTSPLDIFAEQLDVASGDYSLSGTSDDGFWVSGIAVFKVAGAGAFEIPADGGTYAITGTAASLQATRIFDAAAGSYTITGTAATLIHARSITVDSGDYVITGTAAGLQATRIVAADGGTYLLTGTAADLLRDALISALSGTYVITGTDATLVFTGGAAVIGTVMFHHHHAQGNH